MLFGIIIITTTTSTVNDYVQAFGGKISKRLALLCHKHVKYNNIICQVMKLFIHSTHIIYSVPKQQKVEWNEKSITFNFVII